MQYHIDRRVSDLMQSGLLESEARRRIMLELGGLTQVQEEVRDVWLTPLAARFDQFLPAGHADSSQHRYASSC